MSYARVIPRDLFNEANLLKCLGQLYIALDNEQGHDAVLELTDDTGGWEIDQSPDDGSIRAWNVRLTVKGVDIPLYRPLNSRQPHPLWVEVPTFPPVPGCQPEDFRVFTEEGKLSDEFRLFVGLPI